MTGESHNTAIGPDNNAMGIDPYAGWQSAADLIYARFIPRGKSIHEWIGSFVDAISAHYPESEREEIRTNYRHVITSRRFLPTSAALANFDKELRALAGCIVQPTAPYLAGPTYEALTELLRPLHHGIGVGLDFSPIPPRFIEGPSDQPLFHPGVVSILCRICDESTKVDPQRSIKHAALMGSLVAQHPDVFPFISLKANERTKRDSLRVINISLALDSEFIEAAESGILVPCAWGTAADSLTRLSEKALREAHDHSRQLSLPPPDLSISSAGTVHSRTAGKDVGALRDGLVMLDPQVVLRAAAEAAHRCGDPGLINLRAINRDNPTYSLARPRTIATGVISATTPCGEQPLIDGEMCHLGSVALSRHIRDGKFDRPGFMQSVRYAVQILDDVLTCNRAGFGNSDQIIDANRKLGIGVMGFADLLAILKVPYDSDQALELADEIGAILKDTSHRESFRLAMERGPFPNWPLTAELQPGALPRRNATLTTIAPTGFISNIAGCNPSIEPFFSISALRQFAGQKLEVPRPLQHDLRALDYSIDAWVMATVEKNPAYRFDGTLTSLTDEPSQDPELNRRLRELKPAYRTAREISPQFHLSMVHAWQRHIDNGVSKTINLPEGAGVEQILDLYREAIRLDLKGITVFRDRSLSEQAWTDTWPCSSCDGLVPPFQTQNGPGGEGPIVSCQA